MEEKKVNQKNYTLSGRAGGEDTYVRANDLELLCGALAGCLARHLNCF